MESYPKAVRNDWVKIWSGQAVLAVTACYWTIYCTDALSSDDADAMQNYLDVNNGQIDDIVELVR